MVATAVKEARAIVASAAELLQAERVTLEAAEGRVLAQEARASRDIPPFDHALRDGFALRAADTAGASAATPRELASAGSVRAGQVASNALRPGQCAEVMTGAPLPAGADAVVAVEQSSGFGGAQVQVREAARVGQHIRSRGEELAQGESALAAGRLLRAWELGWLRAAGVEQLEVIRRARVTLLSTGDEIASSPHRLGDNQIPPSNLLMLSRLIAACGAEVCEARNVPDDEHSTREALKRASSRSDAIVSCGGVSRGRFDFVAPALRALEMELLFHRVAQRPGEPMLVARQGRCVLFGLPGRPEAALVTFLVYVEPWLRAVQGLPGPTWLSARLAVDMPRDPLRQRWIFGHVWQREEGLVAAPLARKGRGRALGAQALLAIEPGERVAKAGSIVALRMLPSGEISAAPEMSAPER